MLLMQAACVTTGQPSPESETMLARTVNERAIRAAVSHPGTTVCRQLMVGIAERDWVRGEVVEVGDQIIGVRIRDSGRFPHMVGKTAIVPGTVIWAAPVAWTPCV
jgi:hypothetical protein